MFTDSLTELARRKEQLIARAEQQRMAISVSCLRLRKPLGMVDRGIAVVRYLQAHPLLLAAGILAAAAIGRRNLLNWVGRGLFRNLPSWVGRGLFVWRALRSVRLWPRKSGA